MAILQNGRLKAEGRDYGLLHVFICKTDDFKTIFHAEFGSAIQSHQ